MTPSTPPPRRLERSTTDRVFGGVCGGVADYLGLDATMVRLVTVVLSLFFGAPILIYLLALFLIPEAVHRPGPPPPPYRAVPPPAAGNGWPRSRPTEDQVIWGSEGAPWEQPPAAPAPGQPDRRTTRPTDGLGYPYTG